MADFYGVQSVAGLSSLTPTDGDGAIVVESGIVSFYIYNVDTWEQQTIQGATSIDDVIALAIALG